MKKLMAPVLGVGIIILLIKTNALQTILRFAFWLVNLERSAPDVSFGSQILIYLLTFAATYTAVGAIFSFVGWFDRQAMHFAYYVISTVLGFGLCYTFHFVETHLWLIWVLAGAAILRGAAWLIEAWITDRKKERKNTNGTFRIREKEKE